jgi:hypothetical protein
MPKNEATLFACPTCGAEYKVMRVEAKTTMPEGRLTCPKCGGPLSAREGRYILKYYATASLAGSQGELEGPITTGLAAFAERLPDDAFILQRILNGIPNPEP